jgi:hypothetical protein
MMTPSGLVRLDIVCQHLNHTIMLRPCRKHRRYMAKRRPRVNCEHCWRLYIHTHPEFGCQRGVPEYDE